MSRRRNYAKKTPKSTSIPAIVAFVLIAGIVFATMKLWHESQLPEPPSPGLTDAEAAALVQSAPEAQATPYDSATPLSIGGRYRSQQLLRVLRAKRPAQASAADLADLWADPERRFTLIAKGEFEVVAIDEVPARSPAGSTAIAARWYRVQIPEDCLQQPLAVHSLDAWLDDTQMVGVPLTRLTSPRDSPK